MSRLSSTDTPVEEEAEVVESDEAREALLAKIQTELGDAVVGSHLSPGDDLWVRVDRSAWAATGAYLKTGLGFEYFNFLSAIDWKPSPSAATWTPRSISASVTTRPPRST